MRLPGRGFAHVQRACRPPSVLSLRAGAEPGRAWAEFTSWATGRVTLSLVTFPGLRGHLCGDCKGKSGCYLCGCDRRGDRHGDRQAWGRADVGMGKRGQTWGQADVGTGTRGDGQLEPLGRLAGLLHTPPPPGLPIFIPLILCLQWPCVCVSAHARVHASVHIQGARVGERTAWVSALLWARASRPSSSQASAVSSPPHRCVGSHLCSSTPGFREF